MKTFVFHAAVNKYKSQVHTSKTR